MKTIATFSILAVLVVSSKAVTIFDQIGTGSATNTIGQASQNFPDATPYSIIAVEDFTTTTTWRIDSVDMVGTFWGNAAPNPANITSWQFAVYSSTLGNGGSPDANNTGDVINATIAPASVTVTPSFGGNASKYLFQVDMTGLNLNLAAGSYWFGLAPTMAISTGGQIGVVGSSLVDSSSLALNARQMNGSGGFGFSGNNQTIGAGANQVNLAYRINASPVPEPASMAALGVGALALIRRRRNRK